MGSNPRSGSAEARVEGLDHPEHFFMFRDGHQPLAGNGVILSSTDDGDEAPCTLLLDWVKDRVTFMDLAAAHQWCLTHGDA
jgi:hypothetical protein